MGGGVRVVKQLLVWVHKILLQNTELLSADFILSWQQHFSVNGTTFLVQQAVQIKRKPTKKKFEYQTEMMIRKLWNNSFKAIKNEKIFWSENIS